MSLSYKEEVMMMGLEKMFKEARFSICTVRELAVILGNGSIPRDMEAEFSLLHCVPYADIPRSLRSGLTRRVIEALSYSTPPGIDLNVDEIHEELLRRLRAGFVRETPSIPEVSFATSSGETVTERSWTFKSLFTLRH